MSENKLGDEAITPYKYIQSAIAVMGKIDLDPATSEVAQDYIGATNYITKEQDSLSHVWTGSVWLNPPYSRGQPGKFVDHLIDEWISGNVYQAILLTNNATETHWWQKAYYFSRAVVFHKGRINFLRQDLTPTTGNRYAQTFFYLGPNVPRFSLEFGQYGAIHIDWDSQRHWSKE